MTENTKTEDQQQIAPTLVLLIESEHHSKNTILHWMREDRKEIFEMKIHRRNIEKLMQKYAFNHDIRKSFTEHWRDVTSCIEALEHAFEINYKEKYKLL